MLLFPLEMLLLVLATQATTDLDDRALALQIKQGDQQAFKDFFERYHRMLYRYLLNRGIDARVCDDLVQQAFVTIWERRDQINERKSLRSFLFTIGHNRALNHFRDTARFVRGPEPEDRITAGTADADTEHSLMQQTLASAITALPERRRAVFELCFVQELTYREAAAVLEVSVKTVENQMGHALKAIRKAMADYR